METSENKFEIIHETINKANNKLSVTMLCEIAGVSRSGYYNWVHSADKRDKKEEQDRGESPLRIWMMKKVIKQNDIAIYWLENKNPFFLICP